MKEIDEYIELLYKHVKVSDKEIADLKAEMKSHLMESVRELQAEGKSEQESIRIAVERFGDPIQLGRELPRILMVSRRRLSKVFFAIGGVMLVIIISISVICFNNLKEQAKLRRADLTKEAFIHELQQSQKDSQYYIGLLEQAVRLAGIYGNDSGELSKTLKASHNIRVIDQIGDMNKTFKYHNAVLIAIAVIAADTDYECPCFKDIAELGVMKLSDSMAVINLAEKAREAKTQGDRAAIQVQVQLMKKTADFKTYQQAMSYNLELEN